MNPSPPVPGIIRSTVSTSGLNSCTISKASSPSRAIPTTSMKGLRLNICLMTFRTYAESSTINTRKMRSIQSPLLLDVHERSFDLLQLKTRRTLQQRFGRPDEQIARARHHLLVCRDDLADHRFGKINEHIPTEDDSRSRQVFDV